MGEEDNKDMMPIFEYTDLSTPIDAELSPYEADYPIRCLYNGIRTKLEEAESFADGIYKLVVKDASIVSQVKEATQKGVRYVVDLTEDTLQKLEREEIKFEVTKAGKMTAQLKNGNKFGEKMPIKKESFRKGIDPSDMANALQMKALQEQLQDVANQIALIDYCVKDVLQGQQNDRIGLYYSGLRLFLEARNTKDPALRNALLVQALKTLSDSSFQLVETMKSDIAYLVNHEYEGAKGKRIELINERMGNIHKSFEFIHQSSMLRAAIYCQQKTAIDEWLVMKDDYESLDRALWKLKPDDHKLLMAYLAKEIDYNDIAAEFMIEKASARKKIQRLRCEVRYIVSPEIQRHGLHWSKLAG